MTTTENYFQKAAKLGIPEPLKEIHNTFIKEASKYNWRPVTESQKIKDTVNLYFEKYDKLTTSAQKEAKTAEKPKKEITKKEAKTAEKPKKEITKKKAKTTEKPKKNTTKKVPETIIEKPKRKANQVVELRPEIVIIRKFLSIVNKKIALTRVYNLLKNLQKTFLQGKFDKTSYTFDSIRSIQKTLTGVVAEVERNPVAYLEISVPQEHVKKLENISALEDELKSRILLKQFVDLQGRTVKREKVLKLSNEIVKFGKENPGVDEKLLGNALKTLKTYLHDTDKASFKVTINDGTILGINKSLKVIRGKGPKPHISKDGVISSHDVMKVTHSTIGLKGKYHKLLGDPEKNFKMMIWGKPGQGKSTFALEFGRHLAANHGRVLYYSPEEHGAITLQDKLGRVGGPIIGLDFCGDLSNVDLKQYSILFIDSKDSARMKLDDFTALHKAYPKLAIVIIAQATKKGEFRGGAEWEHEVDTVVKVEKGHAETGKNRYKQPQTMKFM